MWQSALDTGGEKYDVTAAIQARSKGSLSNGRLRKEKRVHKVGSSCVSRTEMKTLSPSGYVSSLEISQKVHLIFPRQSVLLS